MFSTTSHSTRTSLQRQHYLVSYLILFLNWNRWNRESFSTEDYEAQYSENSVHYAILTLIEYSSGGKLSWILIFDFRFRLLDSVRFSCAIEKAAFGSYTVESILMLVALALACRAPPKAALNQSSICYFPVHSLGLNGTCLQPDECSSGKFAEKIKESISDVLLK